MRTTLTIDDPVARQLRDEAHRTGRSFKAVVNETLRAGLARRGTPRARRPYRLEPVSLGEVIGGHNLDRALDLAARLEDEEIMRKLQQRK